LLLSAHHCGISAGRSAAFRLNYYLIENLKAEKDLQAIRWYHRSGSIALCLRLKGIQPTINEVHHVAQSAPHDSYHPFAESGS
jgi:hypothetical protein